VFCWAPNGVANAARLYADAERDSGAFRYPKAEVPNGITFFPPEPWQVSRHWAESRHNIRRGAQVPRGGRFAEKKGGPAGPPVIVRSFAGEVSRWSPG
jgi:hypothetical protein